MMRARLLCRTGELSGNTHAVSAETVIGRGSGSDVVLASELISARHACIRQDHRGFVLEDLGSDNGTWLDGERVTQPVRLDHLNVITLARTVDLIFHTEADAPKAVAPKAAVPTPTVAKPAAPTPSVSKPAMATPVVPTSALPAPPAAAAQETHFFGSAFDQLPTLEADTVPPSQAVGGETIEVGSATIGMMGLPGNLAGNDADPADKTQYMDGPFDLPSLEPDTPVVAPSTYCLVISGAGFATQTVELAQRRRYTLGRAIECDISLDGEQVSRLHLTVTVDDVVTVEDAGSSNGTHLDGQRIRGPVEIRPGTSVTLGQSISVQLIRR